MRVNHHRIHRKVSHESRQYLSVRTLFTYLTVDLPYKCRQYLLYVYMFCYVKRSMKCMTTLCLVNMCASFSQKHNKCKLLFVRKFQNEERFRLVGQRAQRLRVGLAGKNRGAILRQAQHRREPRHRFESHVACHRNPGHLRYVHACSEFSNERF